MSKRDLQKAPGPVHAAGQAVTELAVFGAILIFILGTIIRTVVSNGYQQDISFKAMRMAMLASWNDSKANPGMSPQVTAHNSASVLFVEDRLVPGFGKYGALDRTPFMVSGSGTFSYNLLYPIDNNSSSDINNSLPIMDVYIDGQHFPFTMASYVTGKTIYPPGQGGTAMCDKNSQPISSTQEQEDCLTAGGNPQDCQQKAQAQCQMNQTCRNQREWGGQSILKESALDTNNPPVAPITATTTAGRELQEANNACTIFTELANAHVISPTASTYCDETTSKGTVNPSWNQTPWTTFEGRYENAFHLTAQQATGYLAAIEGLVEQGSRQYKLLYTLVANPGAAGGTANSSNLTFSTSASTCSAHGTAACMNKELSTDVPLLGYWGNPTTDGTYSTNQDGVMQYDLLRMGVYGNTPASSTSVAGVMNQFPNPGCNPPGSCMRAYIAWQWAATAGTSAAEIGLSSSNHVYPTYDIDGRLKEVTVYNLSTNSNGWPVVSYEDPDGGDIDGAWDANSCGPQPGLQANAQVFTFTKNSSNATDNRGGTYLLIQEGKIYNPETDQFVRSRNKKDSIDLIQRVIQLSNNTGRFCNGTVPLATVGNDGKTPNPVEVCVDGISNNCFSSQTNIASTCYDLSQNKIFVRSRIEDLRGHFWATDTSGRYKVGN